MHSAFRSVVAIVGGALVGLFVIAGIEYIGTLVFPAPAGLDPRDPGDLVRIVAAAPLGARVLVVAAWTIGAFIGSYVATRYARRSPALHGRIVTALILIATIANLAQFAHPGWMWVIGLLGVIVGGLGAARNAGVFPATKPAF